LLIDRRRSPDTHVLVLLSHHQVYMRTLRYDIHTDSKRFSPVHSFYNALLMLKPRSHRANSAGAFMERWKQDVCPLSWNTVYAWSPLMVPPTDQFWDAQNMAVRKGQFSALAKLITALTAPSQSLTSLDESLWTLGSAANAEILNARPPLLLHICLGGNQTLHKLWWSGCMRFKSGHGIVGEVSGVEAVIHCGDEF